jgi:hypothetical protein
MKKHGATRTSLRIGWGVVPDEKFEGVGRIFLSHLVIQMIRGKRLLGGQDEMTIVVHR